MILFDAIALMAGVAFIFGLLIIFVSRKFAVQENERVIHIEEMLPGVNCGGCGYASCHAYAEAVAKGEASPSLCVVGGTELAQRLAEYVGAEAETSVRKVARVNCSNGPTPNSLKYEYIGIQTCAAATLVNNGPKKCIYGCIGFGDCVAACPFDAIHIKEFGQVPFVEEDKCTGCGLCVEACPRDIIDLVPIDKRVYVKCNSKDMPPDSKKNCDTNPCIACRLCEKACEYDAIHVNDFLAKIDYTKCTNCEACVKVCPTNAIVSLLNVKYKLHI